MSPVRMRTSASMKMRFSRTFVPNLRVVPMSTRSLALKSWFVVLMRLTIVSPRSLRASS